MLLQMRYTQGTWENAFVFTTWIEQSNLFSNLKFQASIQLLPLYRLVCVRPGRNPNYCVSHAQAHLYLDYKLKSNQQHL